MTKIILVRHGEEPKNKKYLNILSHIGLTYQGATRAYLMPRLIEQVVKNNKYEVHTYTHSENDIPTSRSYYTVGLLNAKRVFYKKSDNINELVKNIKNSKSKYIVVCWEHGEFKNIITKLIGKKINYNDVVEDLKKANSNNMGKTFDVELRDLRYISRCSVEYSFQNEECKFDTEEDDMMFAPVWLLNLDKKKLKVFAGFKSNFNDTKDKFNIIDYSDVILKL